MNLEQLQDEARVLEAQLAAEIERAQIASRNVERLSGALVHTRQLIAREEAPPVPDFARLAEAIHYAGKRERRKARKARNGARQTG